MRNVCHRGVIALALVFGLGLGWTGSPVFEPSPALAQASGEVPGGVLGSKSTAEVLGLTGGASFGNVTIPDKKAGQIVQSDGMKMQQFRNGPLATYGAYGLGAMILLLVVFFLLRGRIKIEAGPSGQTVERFNSLERAVHWLTASSFVVLALSGLNLMYGKLIVMPIFGQEAFASLTYYGKLAHNYLGFAFMVGIALMFVLWVRNNIPSKVDLIWLAKGGGLFSKGVHPPSPRFNAGQKLIFWTTILGGITLSTSGVMLIFPFEYAIWAKTFGVLNAFGADLPTQMTPLMETQMSLVWHGMAALVMMVIIIAHIYIGSIGMEGAIHAVGSGQVDTNWAKEHHNMWVAELEGRDPQEVLNHGHQPAE